MVVRKTQEEFVGDAKRFHGNKYDYSKTVYHTSKDTVTITCPIHGDFRQVAYSHLRGGCARCPRHSSVDQVEFERRATSVHSGKYEYAKSDYQRSANKLIITCPLHGDFQQYPQNHLRGQGCRRCTDDTRSTSVGDWIQAATQKHSGVYDYQQVGRVRCKDIVTIGCRKHGEICQRAGSHLRGEGCPRCSKRVSKSSLLWLEAMSRVDDTQIQHGGNGGEVRLTGTRMHADGFSVDLNKVYEYLGDYYHGNPRKYAADTLNKTSKQTMGELHTKTLKRRKLIESLGYSYEEIWEDEFKVAETLRDLGSS